MKNQDEMKIIKQHRASLILAGILSLSAISASAQMTLNDCLVFARDHAHANRINRIETEKAAADKRIAQAGVMPYVEYNMSGNMSFGRNIDPGTNTYDNKKTISSGFGIGMSLPLFDGLVTINNIHASEMARQRMRKTADIEQDKISLQVIASFYNVFYCRALVDQMSDNFQRDSLKLVSVIKEERVGTKSNADVAEMRALLASDEYELTNQRNLLDKAYLRLRSDMGMQPSEEPLDLTDPELEHAGSAKELPGMAKEGGFIHPEIEEASLALRESRYNLRAAKGAFSPKISFNAGISTSYYRMIGDNTVHPGFGRQWRDNMGQYLGLTFSMPLFTGLSDVNRLKKARLDVKEREERLEQTRFRIRKESAEALLDYESALKECNAAEGRLAAEQQAFRAVSRKFELGAASAIDYYTGSARLTVAKATLTGKRIQAIVNRITLGYYNGEKLIKEHEL